MAEMLVTGSSALTRKVYMRQSKPGVIVARKPLNPDLPTMVEDAQVQTKIACTIRCATQIEYWSSILPVIPGGTALPISRCAGTIQADATALEPGETHLMLEILSNPATWASFLSLCLLEIILGVDNVLFVSIAASKLPREQRKSARVTGLSIALATRILLLLSLTWVITLTEPLFALFGIEFGWRELILAAGGLFLVIKASHEIFAEMEAGRKVGTSKGDSFAKVILQIAVIDVVFSIDSVITAIGIAEHVEVMIAAIVVSMIVMIIAAEVVASFIEAHPSAKMLGLAFLVLIGVVLIAEGFHQHLDKGFVYAAMLFATIVELLNVLRNKIRRKRS